MSFWQKIKVCVNFSNIRFNAMKTFWTNKKSSTHSGVAIEAAKSFFLLYFRRKCMCAKTFSALLHHFFCHWVCISPTDLHNFCNCWFKLNIYRPKSINLTMVGFIYILDSSNSSSFTLWFSKFSSSSRCHGKGISNGKWNGSWTDKHSSHFSTAKDMSVKATFFFM